ncbi:MAG: methyltransferase domain-containing protein [Leptospiraceae bacterium]|nr:methyltransferase domain-containing protein [Leptospiraceae bacterium]
MNGLMIEEHWNKIFKNTIHEKLGWYEGDYTQTFQFLELTEPLKEKTVFIPGAGTTELADLLQGKVKKLILNDLSSEALLITKQRLRNTKSLIEYLQGDISGELLIEKQSIDVWIDRAVLHFLNAEDAIKGYFSNVVRNLKVNGYILLAEFSKDGAPKCAGLDLHRYSLEELQMRLGDNFKLIKQDNFTYINPSGGERPYIYALFQRIQ